MSMSFVSALARRDMVIPSILAVSVDPRAAVERVNRLTLKCRRRVQ